MPNKPPQTPSSLPPDDPQPLAVLRTHWKKFFFGAAGTVLLIWGLAVVGDGLIGRSKHWVTELAGFVRQPVTISAQALFVREETPLPGAAQGTVVPLTEPGARVGKGQPYALVCRNAADAETLRRQRMLEQRLLWLRDAEEAKAYKALNAEQLGRQVDDCFTDFLKALDGGGCAGLSARQEIFLHRATTLEAALGRPVDFTAETAETKRQLEELRAQINPDGFSRLQSPASGDYYPAADGLERALTPQALEGIDTPEALRALQEMEPTDPPDASLGKLVTGFRWYIAAVLPGGRAQQLEEGEKYQVMFPQESARSFSMKAEKIRRGGAEAVVVFSCDENDDTVRCLRGARAEIVMDTVDGLKVPSAALRFLEKGEGQARLPYTAVYIVRAGQLQLREVEVLYQDESTAVVAWGRLNEAQPVWGDRITVKGKVQSVTKPAENRLLITGQDLTLLMETDMKALGGGPPAVAAAKRALFNETIVSGKNLAFQQKGETLVLTGEDIEYREQRGVGLKIHDTVLVGGKGTDAAA